MAKSKKNIKRKYDKYGPRPEWWKKKVSTTHRRRIAAGWVNPNKGKAMSEEQKVKISAALTNKPKPWWKGKHHSKKTKQKISEASKRFWASHISPSKGKVRSAAARTKISLALKGRKITKSWKEKIAATKAQSGLSVGYKKRFQAIDGNLYRSKFEVSVADLLYSFSIPYQYEKPLPLSSGFVFPDFTILQDGKQTPRCLIEVSGAAYPKWANGLICKIRKIRQVYKTLPVVIVTYRESFNRLSDVLKIPRVRVIYTDAPLPENLSSLTVESDHFNFDYTHFLPWHKGQCASLHGHSSTVSVGVRGIVDDKGMLIDFAIVKRLVKKTLRLVDHKVMVPSNCIKTYGKKSLKIEFKSKGRTHKLDIPKDEVFILKQDSTVENLAGVLAELILKRLPSNITDVVVQMNEGVGKTAITTKSMVGRDLSNHSINLSTQKDKILKMLTFYQHVPMK